MTEATNPIPHQRSWAFYASYIAAFAMVISFSAALIQFLYSRNMEFKAINESAGSVKVWDASGALVICAFTTIEAIISLWMVKNLKTIQKRMALYRLIEWAFILIAVKVFTELRGAPPLFWNAFLTWQKSFPGSFFSFNYVLNLMPAIAAWVTGYIFSVDLYLLGTNEDMPLDKGAKTAPIRNMILKHFLILGMLTVLLVGFTPQNIYRNKVLIFSANITPTILYFALGFILISLTRYTNLETTWHQAKIPVPIEVPRRWLTSSIFIIGSLAVLAAWLPTNYANGFFDFIRTNINYLGVTLFYIISYTVFLFVTIFNLHDYSPSPSNPTPTPTPTITPTPTPTPTITTAGVTATDLAVSVFVWMVLAVLVFIAIRQYLSFNRDLIAELKKFKLLRWLSTVWETFKAAFVKANETAGKYIRNRIKRLRKRDASPAVKGDLDYVILQLLDPRQKIFFYYLTLIKKAEEAGIHRQHGQTPYEYALSVTSKLKEGKDDVATLTESFVEARYSRHDIPTKEANRIKATWEAVRRALRNVHESR